MKTITREWIMAHRTPKGAWTRAQIEALGIRWPAKNGWITRACGTEITELQANAFEKGKFVTASMAKNGETPELPLQTTLNHQPTISERLDCIEMHVAAIRKELAPSKPIQSYTLDALDEKPYDDSWAKRDPFEKDDSPPWTP